MGASNYLEDKIRNHINGHTAYTAPANVYIGLHTADPGETGATAEVTGGGYARVQLANSSAGWAASSGGSAANAAAVQFANASAAWGTVTHYSKWDAITAGNCLEYSALTSSKVIASGDPGPIFNVGTIVESVS